MRERWPLWLQTLLVSALLVVTGALVGYVVHRTPTPSAQDLSAPLTAPTMTTGGSPSPTPSPAASPDGDVLSLSAYSPMVALRSLSGASCPDAGAAASRLELTTDGGRSWSRLGSPATQVLRVRLTSAQAGWLIGRTADCVAGYYASTDSGTTWTGAQSTAGAWFVVPGSPVVHLAAGGVSRPCPVRTSPQALTVISELGAQLACVGGGTLRLLATTDGGTVWTPVVAPAVSDVLGEDSLLGATVLAARGVGCPGTSLWRQLSAGAAWTRSACLPAATSAAVGYATATDLLAVLDQTAGLVTYTSTDAGQTWTRVSPT